MQRRTCNGRRKDGQPCKGPAVGDADKCRMHLGKKTAGVIAERKARQALARLDVPAVDDPLSELGRIAGQVVAWKDTLAEQVNQLSSLRYSTEGGEQLRAEVALWERAMDRCEKFLTAMAKLNIDERLARVTEQQAALVADALAVVLSEMGFSPDQQRDARSRVGRRLRNVA